MQADSAKRAPYYIKRARQLYRRGLLQKQGRDKTNSDPFIKGYEAQTQILGALDLDPDSPKIWLEAGKVLLALADIEEDENSKLQEAISFFAKACRLEPAMYEELQRWLSEGDAPEKWLNTQLPPTPEKFRKQAAKVIQQWSKNGVPNLAITIFSKEAERDHQGSCDADSESLGKGSSDDTDRRVEAHMESFQHRILFPTYILLANLNHTMPAGFCGRLADIAAKKYDEYGRQRRARQPNVDPNDLNDGFFSWQQTQDSALDDPRQQARWPELYRDSEDFRLLRKVQKNALRNFARHLGLVPPGNRDGDMTLWAAVYPGDGGRHGYHSHQSSLASCVLYCRTPGSRAGPITFLDPRGATPMNDYEQHLGERDFEPTAPFHRSEYLFPEVGDHVCFPSWLIHGVPSHHEDIPRVAFSANLQLNRAWDGFLRTAIL